MSQRGKVSETPYMQLMRQAVKDLVGEDYDAFNQDQLAAKMNVRKTDSFRKRLNQLVAEQVLVSWAYYTDKGGTGMAYASVRLEQLDMFDGYEV